jgi:hypothetical protein
MKQLHGAAEEYDFTEEALNNSSGYVGPTLSRQELKQCLESQNSINAAIDRLEAEEVNLNKEQTPR